MSQLGVHSEAGKLRTVLVCEPGLAHERLTPDNCDGLLFDDVLWVDVALKYWKCIKCWQKPCKTKKH